MPKSRTARVPRSETSVSRPAPLLRVGALVIAKQASGVCTSGEAGVCFEEYRIGNRLGWSVIFQGGRYDGFSPEDVELFLQVTGQVAPDVADYRFTNVGQLARDHQAGRFDSAFQQALAGHPPRRATMTRRITVEALAEQIMNAAQSRGTIGCPREGQDRAARIRALNDALRTSGRGGITVMTESVAALGLAKVNAIFAAVAAFTAFTPDNDPYGEHDCATLTVEGLSVIFKVDYYDRTLTYHSPDPTCPKLTVRVLTVMLASDY